MWNDNLMQPPQEKNDFFAEFLENSLKNWAFFRGFAILPYGIKDFLVYLIDIGSHLLTLIQNNIEQS